MSGESKAIALREETGLDPYAFEPSSIDEALRVGQLLLGSGLTQLKTPEQAAVLIMKGRSLNLTAMQALEGLYVVRQRPAVYTQTAIGLIRQDPSCEYFEQLETSAEGATWVSKRRGRPEKTHTFTWNEAHELGYPQRNEHTWKDRAWMLSMRCASRLARLEWSHVLQGFGTVEELEDEGPAPTIRSVEEAKEAKEPSTAAGVVKEALRAKVAGDEKPNEEPEEPEEPAREPEVDDSPEHVPTAHERLDGFWERLVEACEGDEERAAAAWNARLPGRDKGLASKEAQACLGKAKTLVKKMEVAKRVGDLTADLRELDAMPAALEERVRDLVSEAPAATVAQLEAMAKGLEKRKQEASRG